MAKNYYYSTFDNSSRQDVMNYSKVKRSKSSDSSWMLPAGSTWNEELWRKSSLLAACIPQAEATSDQWFPIFLVQLFTIFIRGSYLSARRGFWIKNCGSSLIGTRKKLIVILSHRSEKLFILHQIQNFLQTRAP